MYLYIDYSLSLLQPQANPSRPTCDGPEEPAFPSSPTYDSFLLPLTTIVLHHYNTHPC